MGMQTENTHLSLQKKQSLTEERHMHLLKIKAFTPKFLSSSLFCNTCNNFHNI